MVTIVIKQQMTVWTKWELLLLPGSHGQYSNGLVFECFVPVFKSLFSTETHILEFAFQMGTMP
jgi:hypothetical protein